MTHPAIFTTSIRMNEERVRQAPAKAAQLARALQDALGRAHSYTDPNLSQSGLEAKRRELATEFRQAATNDMNALREETKSSREYLASIAVAVRPKIENDPAALIRAQQKWEQARMQLEAGVPIVELLRKSDVETTIAVEEFAPSWIAAKNYRTPELSQRIYEGLGMHTPDEEPEPYVNRVITERLAELSPPDIAFVISAAAAAGAQERAAEPWLGYAGRLVEGQHADAVGTAISASMAAAEIPAVTGNLGDTAEAA